jgi:molybdopterin/thiamine biosynthesis adenylyltransferase
MSRIQIDRNSDLRKLREAGYNIFVTDTAYLVVRDVPYVNSKGQVAIGSLACALELAGDLTVKPTDHTVKFIGEYPCDSAGNELAVLRQNSDPCDLGSGLVSQHGFSRKPPDGYADYFAKMTTYVKLLQGPAREIESTVTAKTRQVVEPEYGESPFNYLDTASARSETSAAAAGLSALRIAIVGLGGTGSYILDAVAKTPVSEIHLFDADAMLTHNAFRAPGAASLEELRAQQPKVEYLQNIYSRMHRGIRAHRVKVDRSNADELQGMSFVFLSMDSGNAKRAIIEYLEAAGTPFIDVGMGLQVNRNKISGILRAVTSLPDARDQARGRISFAEDDVVNEYDKNIQVAELNALNACLAIIAWKKHFGYYADMGHERFVSYSVAGGTLNKSDIHAD